MLHSPVAEQRSADPLPRSGPGAGTPCRSTEVGSSNSITCGSIASHPLLLAAREVVGIGRAGPRRVAAHAAPPGLRGQLPAGPERCAVLVSKTMTADACCMPARR